MTTQLIREEHQGKLILRLTQTNAGFDGELSGETGGRTALLHGTTAKEVWARLEREARKPKFVDFEGARARFLREYPQGFETPGYIADERREKDMASARLNEIVPLTEAAVGAGFGEAALRVFTSLNLLSVFEKARIQAALRSSSGDAVVRALANFALDPGSVALAEIDLLLRPHNCANWAVATFLPFLWQPDRHIFLKPMVTKEFPVRVKHSFAYQSRLDFAVYHSLMDLVAWLEAKLTDLRPKDRIDVQSFIWVVGQPEPARP